MRAWKRSLRMGLAAAVFIAVSSCGSSSNLAPPPPPPPPTGNNVASVVVDSGPTSTNPGINTLFVSVTLCVPGSTTNCQTIDHVQVDTGSVGLRILSSALSLTLPLVTNSSGNAFAECDIFGVGFSWGPIVTADMSIVGETAKSLPIQIIGDPRFPVPADCSGTGGEEDTVVDFGANGLLGVGPFTQDCPACVNNAFTNPGVYYACPPTTGAACMSSVIPLSAQVVNPVALFPKDNNGVIISLPTVPVGGAQTVSGTLTFGIDTESNNASGSQTVLTVNGDEELTMTFMGVALPQSFIDSGSNGIFFNDPNIQPCVNTFTDFYCPGNILSLTVSITGQNGMMANNLPFNVANAQMIPLNVAAYPGVAGTSPLGSQSFDWGLAFFYGRRVAVAIEGNSTSVGTGPYIAF
jgi:Protein of unknown function (DUF3443)